MASHVDGTIKEELKTLVTFDDFRSQWEARETLPGKRLASKALAIGGWKLEIALKEISGQVRLQIEGRSDNRRVLFVEEFIVESLGGVSKSFGELYVMMPSWIGKVAFTRKVGTLWGWSRFATPEQLLASADANDGKLSTEVTVRVATIPLSIDPPSCLKLPTDELVNAFADMDLITVTGDSDCEVKIPRRFVCAHSQVLGAALESGMEEAKTKVINMKDASKQSIEDLRDCLVSGGLPPSIVTAWQRVLDVLILASKYAITPLADACTIYLCMAISFATAPKMLMASDKFGLSKLRKAVMCFTFSSTQSYDAVVESDEYNFFSADLLREFYACSSVREKRDALEVAMPPNAQWGDTPHEFSDTTDWQTLTQAGLRRACFERLLGTVGTKADLVARLVAQTNDTCDSQAVEPHAKRQRTGS